RPLVVIHDAGQCGCPLVELGVTGTGRGVLGGPEPWRATGRVSPALAVSGHGDAEVLRGQGLTELPGDAAEEFDFDSHLAHHRLEGLGDGRFGRVITEGGQLHGEGLAVLVGPDLPVRTGPAGGLQGLHGTFGVIVRYRVVVPVA